MFISEWMYIENDTNDNALEHTLLKASCELFVYPI